MARRLCLPLLVTPFFLGATSLVEEAAIDARGRVNGARSAQDGAVNLYNLNGAVSVTWDDNGIVYVAEKVGIVRSINGWVGQPTNVVLDIQAETFSYGDHGLTSIQYYGGYLYATYMLINPEIGQNCNDYGQMDGRPLDEVFGCITWGRLSRWPIANGAITGPEEVIIDGAQLNSDGVTEQCVQFSTHGAACVIVGGDGMIYATFGDGASFNVPDVGQCGGDPCGHPTGFPGAFRSQDPNRLNGKIIRWNPAGGPYQIVSTGHRNPWRITWANNQLLEIETGWYSVEEMNVIQDGKNYGWPCFEGNIRAPEYTDFWGIYPVCSQIEGSPALQGPVFSYNHPNPPPHPGNIMSITCVAEYNGRIYFGDYTQGFLHSLNEQFQDEQEVARDVYPVELKNTPVGLVYVDFHFGAVKSVALGAALASPSPAPADPYVKLIPPAVTVYSPGSGATLEYDVDTNLDSGREGAKYNWTITLFTDCSLPNCGAQDIPVPHGTNKVLTITTPTTPGTLRVSVVVSTYAGLVRSAPPTYLASGEGQLCTCASKSVSGSSINTSSPQFIGGVTAAAVVVMAAVGLSVWYFVLRKPGGGLPRRPAEAVATSGAKPVPQAGNKAGANTAPAQPKQNVGTAPTNQATAPTAGKAPTTNQASAPTTTGPTGAAATTQPTLPVSQAQAPAAGGSSTSSILSRRPGHPDIPPIGEPTGANAPVKPSPATAVGQDGKTPVGDKKV